jgi:hypothetical protein
MFKKILENLYIYVFLIMIFGILVVSTILPDKDFSEYENRLLQMMPSISMEKIFDGSFQSEFDTYTSDQVVFKDFFVKSKNYLDIAQLKLAVNGVYNAADDFYIERHSKKDYDLEKLKNNIDILNSFKEQYGAEVYLVPNASTILSDKIFLQEDLNFNEALKEIENIDYVDSVLNDYKGDKSDLYYKTDHHWTTIGAYQLYKELVDNPVELNLKEVTNEFYGTINNKLNIAMKPDSIYIHDSKTNFSVYYDLGKEDKGLYFDKYLNMKDKYSYFLDSNHGLIQIINEDINSDEKVLIIKDSYANCLAPLLAENYKQVDLIDFRFFNMPISSYLKTYKYDRIIVLYNKDGFANNDDFFRLKR